MDSRELFGEMPQYDEETRESDMTSQQIQQQVSEKSKKGNNSTVVVFATVLFILLIGLCVYIAVSISGMVSKDGRGDKEYESKTEDPWEEILGDDYKGDEQESQPEAEVSTESTYAYPNYAKDTFTGPYYEDVVDCIDYSVSYNMERKFCNIEESQNNVSIHTSYIYLDGEIPGVEEINRLLEEEATSFAVNYKENKEDILKSLNSGMGIDASIRSYVTYNTENMISIVLWEEIVLDGICLDIRLKCYNINLDTGTVLDNASILELEEGFGQEFRDRSDRQNGRGSVESFSDLQIEQFLADEEAVIFFYTPLGAELGYNYADGGKLGWITITMQDYEEFVAKM